VPVSSKTEIEGFEITIRHPFNHRQWFVTTMMVHSEIDLPNIKLCDETPLSSSLLDDAKDEALNLVAGKIYRLTAKLQKIAGEIQK